MSAAQFTATPQKRRWNGQRRSQITETDLANYGLPPGAKRIAPADTFSQPTAPAPRRAGNPKFWTPLQTVGDGQTTKTTRARQIAAGVVLNTCTRGPAGIAEALVFIPGATLADFA